MGISGLTKVIADHAPRAIRENEIKNYFGRAVAIDASMSLYQFLIAVRSADGQNLANEAGETTSHLMGLFYRTIRMCDNGIKPVYVFDGKPPTLKSGELAKRLERRKEAEEQKKAAEEAGDTANFDKFNRRTVKVTREQNDECKRLLTLMGIPHIDAPCEAEAQCAALAKAGKVFAAGSEDMDTLTFGSPILLRHLTFSEQRKMPISEIHLDKVLEGLEMTMDQFIDLCILLGCDYCDSIKGIGPHRAVQLIKDHKNIEGVLAAIDKSKYKVPDEFPYAEARALFQKPDVVIPGKEQEAEEEEEEAGASALPELKWNNPDVEGLVDFLVKEKGFSEDRVRKAAEKLGKANKRETQVRLDGFFTIVPRDPNAVNPAKRKSAADAAKKDAKKKAGGAAAGKKRFGGK